MSLPQHHSTTILHISEESISRKLDIEDREMITKTTNLINHCQVIFCL